jgi:hypothetical protein
LILALPAFALGWLVFKLPEPACGGASPLPSPAQAGEASAAEEDGEAREQTTDAQRIARERGVEPDPKLVLTGDPRG